jgi:hypothetical protein
MTEKMTGDEMYENRKSEVEAGLGLGEQDEKLTRKVLLKMDSQCVHHLIILPVDMRKFSWTDSI